MLEAASVVVGNVVLNAPALPMVTCCVTEPMEMETISPTGNCSPLPIAPLNVIDAVPA
ncbi:MAG: hypothetical protein WBL50_04350 [Candidatus Acidiferrum sp.]